MNTFTTKCSILALMLIILTQGVYAQKEAYNWYFGHGSGMTWHTTQTLTAEDGTVLTGLPMPLTGSAMNHYGGVFSMSDNAGNLMFYSDGITIWNKNHQVMETGLWGHENAVQSGIVVPYPGAGNEDKYIVLTIGAETTLSTGTFGYSVIDMAQNGGMGGVVTKNVPMTGYKGFVGSTLTVVRHTNGADYWIVAPGKGTGENACINVWKITSAGVDPMCHASYTLPRNTQSPMRNTGQLNFSSDGRYFSWPEYQNLASMHYFFGEFNPSDGSFPVIKDMALSHIGYGSAFSASGEIVYIGVSGGARIEAYKMADLIAASNPTTVPKRTMSTGYATYGMQMGVDGRIYIATNSNTEHMVVIDNVEDYDNFTVHRVFGLLPPGTHSGYGLPNFMAHLTVPPKAGSIGANEAICSGATPTALVSLSIGEGATSFLWEQSTNNATWVPASGTNNQTGYSPPALTQTTYYRRQDINVSGSEPSNVVTITVGLTFSAGTISNTSTSIASGATPNAFTSTPASGGVGVTTYQWQSSPNNSTWTNISGATSATYAPGPLTATTYFRRTATNTCGTVHTTSVLITVSGAADMINTSGSSTSICNGEVAALSASLTTPGSVISPVYRWYSAATGGSPLHTGATYSPMPTTTTTYYVSVSGTSQAESPRKAVVVTVRPVATPDMIKITQ